MTRIPEPSPVPTAPLNAGCVCITLDRTAMRTALAHETGDAAFYSWLGESRPHLFADVAVFLDAAELDQMQSIVEAIEAVVRHPAYRAAVLGWAPVSAMRDFGPRGVFMGYDFHLGRNGPALIEINTNAGGAILNASLARAQRSCCSGAVIPEFMDLAAFDTNVAEMFTREWRHQRESGSPATIAIVDDRPGEQYLYPEFLLMQRLLQRHGYEVCIADPSELEYCDGELCRSGTRIDLVYNRLTDFSLEQPGHAALRAAYDDGSVVLTPNPHNHALFADKRNLTLLSDSARLSEWGVDPALIRILSAGVPATERVTPEGADRFWSNRKQFFFKPSSGYGSRAAYRGDKLTKTVWQEICQGDYVAQAYVAPSERLIEFDGEKQQRKIDVRLYTYDGRMLLVAARLYQGQTTNMRTIGGGFAPVLLTTTDGLSAACQMCAGRSDAVVSPPTRMDGRH
ncbi:hypothetical protein [Rhizorhapis sp. SPR117]|uniref:hypothetical protein n=1 Tax=Rhizorhapis sp. SPR117 TaxID=2912611 RepID=UPI001F30A48B|nr:hypothetical protein [Rhizorhapis sp. SPR117]